MYFDVIIVCGVGVSPVVSFVYESAYFRRKVWVVVCSVAFWYVFPVCVVDDITELCCFVV